MLELRRLRLLRELSIRGTIAEVADVLSYSPSSVSQQLSQLEEEAGVELLRRNGRNLQLTPQAQVLVAHTEELWAPWNAPKRIWPRPCPASPAPSGWPVFQTAMLARDASGIAQTSS